MTVIRNKPKQAVVKHIFLSKAQNAIWESTQQVNLFMGGQGSGKTAVMGVVSARFISEFPQIRGLIAANTYSQLTRSTMFRIRMIWEEYCGLKEYDETTGEGHYVVGITPPSHFNTKGHAFDKYDNIISFSWGTVIYTGSLDNYKSLDGMEVGWMMLDETKDTKEEALNEVLHGRLRQSGMYVEAGKLTASPTDKAGKDNEPFLPMYIFTSPAKVPWLNAKFHLDEHEAEIRNTVYYPPRFFQKQTAPNQLTVIGAAHLNKRNLPKNYIDNQFANIPKERQGALIFGDPFAKTGGEFWKRFDGQKIVRKVAHTYDPELPLHLTFDFNSLPYITCLVYQIRDKAVKQVADICLEPPYNSTPALCDAINTTFKNQVAKVFVYGDPSGHHANKGTTTRDKKSDFDVIMASLNFKLENRVQKSAPSVSVSRDFIDLIMANEYQGISLEIDEKCTRTIDDMKYTKEASDGGMEKKRVKDSKTGQTYEPYGHPSDAKRYFFVSAFYKEYLIYTGKGGTEVMVGKRQSSNNSF